MIVRPAVPEDALSVARVHVRAWQAAYRGFMPDAYLDGLSVEDRARRYNFSVTDVTQPRTLLAEHAGAIVGFATISPARDADVTGRGELCALYVEPESWGRGVGRTLVSAARDALYRLGFRQAVLWVVAGNFRAEHFYRADGWTADGLRRAQSVWSVTVDSVRYSRGSLR
jgi:GNAT superfamily N-acetyltransferase